MVRNKMSTGGLLTTYSSKGSVRRILKELNFEVTKLEGPKGKREMINAVLLNEGSQMLDVLNVLDVRN